MQRKSSIYSIRSLDKVINPQGEQSAGADFLQSFAKVRILIVVIATLLTASQVQAQWSSLGNGLDYIPAAVWGISAPNDTTIWATTWDNWNFEPYDKICKTTDGGENWEVFEVDVNISQWINSIFALDDSIAWVIAGNLSTTPEGEIYKTDDGGETWVLQETAFTEVNQIPTSIHFYDEMEGVAFGGANVAGLIDLISVYRTWDGGNEWLPVEELPTQIIGEGMVNELGNGNHAISGDNIWFPTSEGRVFYSNDRGDTWSVSDPELTGITPNNVISIAMRNDSCGLLISNVPNEVFRTEDGGVTWEDTEFSDGLFSIYQISYVPGTCGTYLMHDGWPNDITLAQVTTDEGLNWNVVFTEESMACVQFLSPTVGFAGGQIINEDEGGLFKWEGSFPACPDTLTSIDSEFLEGSLKVFPNPVTDLLHLQLPPAVQAEQVSIYDLLGKRLWTQGPSGMNSIISIDVSALEGGTYIIELRSKNSISTTSFTKR